MITAPTLVDAPALPGQLQVGRLSFEIRTRPDRRTLEITVERDASLTIKAPNDVTLEQIEEFVRAKQDWIYRKRAEKDALLGAPAVKQIVNGEGFPYLGRSYRLLIVDHQDTPVKLQHGRLRLRHDTLTAAVAEIRSWYSTVGRSWLRRRVTPWANRLGIAYVDLRVLDLGYRWGSTRGRERINIHWATLQLRPSLVDYVLVHELAHLHESNHGPRFWRHVEQAMPDYEPRKRDLARQGADLWLGAAKPCEPSGGAGGVEEGDGFGAGVDGVGDLAEVAGWRDGL